MATWNQLPALKRAASILWPQWGGWAYETWERLNRDCFSEVLDPCGILFGLTPHGRSLGYFRPSDVTITLHPSVTDPRTKDPWGMGAVLGEKYATDVLFHEMIHQCVAQNYDKDAEDSEGTSSHNCTAWVAEVNRLSLLLGMKRKAEVIRQRRVDGKLKWAPRGKGNLELGELARWPLSVRPAGYYGLRRLAHPAPKEGAAH